MTSPTERRTAEVLAARLEVCREYANRTDDASPVERLLTEARNELAPDHELTFWIECALEEVRSRDRSAMDSAQVWESLEKRAEAHLPPDDRTYMRIRSFRGRHVRLRGGPGDVERGVDLYQEEYDRRLRLKGENAYATSMARGNLGYALMSRGSLDDLQRARALLEEEAAEREERYGKDIEFTGFAYGNLGRTLLRLYETAEPPDPSLPATALGIADQLVAVRGRRYGRQYYTTLNAHLLRGHALMLLGRPEEARVEVKYVRAFVTSRRITVERAWLDELGSRLGLV